VFLSGGEYDRSLFWDSGFLLLVVVMSSQGTVGTRLRV